MRLLRTLAILVAVVCCAQCNKTIQVSNTANGEPEPPSDTPHLVLPPVLSALSEEINPSVGGYYCGLPADYQENNQQYPLLIFLHGGGQFGNGNIDLPLLLNEGIPQLLDEKLFPPYFITNGQKHSFVILAPQFKYLPPPADVKSFIDYAVRKYRIDIRRVYLSGMSLGGIITCDVAATYPELIAAVVPMAGVPDTMQLTDKCKTLAAANIPLWIFHNTNDSAVLITRPKTFIQLIESFDPLILPRFTEFSSEGLLGHDAWTRATRPQYREDGKNIYEWMLSFKKLK